MWYHLRMPELTCRCGHEKAAHQHYRRGTDCGVCGATACPRFRKAPAGTPARPLRDPAPHETPTRTSRTVHRSTTQLFPGPAGA